MKTFIMLVCHSGEAEPRIVIEEDKGDNGTLPMMQAQVGGLIETCGRLQLDNGICLDAYCNEEGDNFEPNRVTPCGLVQGPIVITASNAEGATVSLDTVSATARALEWARSWPRVLSPQEVLLQILKNAGMVN